MVLGLSIQAFTIIHVVITLVAIASGFVVLFGMLGRKECRGWTALFLLTTVLTSVTGFLFPIRGFTPAIGVGIISCLLLALAARWTLWQTPCRWLALDLCRLCSKRVLSQRICVDRPIVPKSANLACARADTVRTAVPCCTGGCVGCFPRPRHYRGVQISPGTRRFGSLRANNTTPKKEEAAVSGGFSQFSERKEFT